MPSVKWKKGMTLIEVILAIAILGIILVGISSLFGSSIAQIFKSGHRTQAVASMREIADKLYYDNNIGGFTTKEAIVANMTAQGYNNITDISNIATVGNNVNFHVSDQITLNSIQGFQVTILKFFQNNTNHVETTVFLVSGGL